MAHCFYVGDKSVDEGIPITPHDSGMYIDCGLPWEESVRLSPDWSKEAISSQLHVASLLEENVNALKEKGAPNDAVEAAMVPLRECRYRNPVIDRATIIGPSELGHPRTTRSKTRGNALVYLASADILKNDDQDVGDCTIMYTANTYDEYINKKGSVDRTYHSLGMAVGVDVLCTGPKGIIISMKPHASIRFERTGDTNGCDVRVMLKWMFPRLSWRTLRAAPGQLRQVG